jgi:hypothetical protein
MPARAENAAAPIAISSLLRNSKTKGNGFGKKHQSAPLMQIIALVMGS